jgi:hypothetical protein
MQHVQLPPQDGFQAALHFASSQLPANTKPVIATPRGSPGTRQSENADDHNPASAFTIIKQTDKLSGTTTRASSPRSA